MAVKLFDAELRVMDVLWNEGAVSAAHIAGVL
ncbi:MAG: BlaI/MecI/CopY family transcriptional regulator, partial [Oscillospiraceae bacterium]|nr:BlaI/MecI/CopY family transcriptional regulator [Oscillospiraceae bacterium]